MIKTKYLSWLRTGVKSAHENCLVAVMQGFSRSEVVRVTKMDVNNIAMVWAPNCLRGLSNDPKVIFENTRREMGFVRTLILNLNTNEAVDLI